MRGFPLIPVLETPEEAARFFRRGWFRYYFPRFPISAVCIWPIGPATESIRHLSSSFNLRWIDLAGSLLAATMISVPIWFGYKHAYRDWCDVPPKNDKRPNQALEPTAPAVTSAAPPPSPTQPSRQPPRWLSFGSLGR